MKRNRSSEYAWSFIQELAGAAQAMAALDLVVYRLHCDWGSFGSWSMLVRKGSERKRSSGGPNALWFGWDGRDGVLSIQSASTSTQFTPHLWKTVLEKEFEKSTAALEFGTNYARKFTLEKGG
jgi:hypothetical protein